MGASSQRQSEISVVIPTRNRPDDLARLLRSLALQSQPPDEVIIVDASDPPSPAAETLKPLGSMRTKILQTSPGLCAQRNLGIRAARGEFVLLADDDIEFPPDYIEILAGYLRAHEHDGAVSGMLEEAGAAGNVVPDKARLSSGQIVWRFLFQQTVWGDISCLETSLVLRPILRFYRNRGNALSLAGWPLLTNAREPLFRTAVYGLGGAMVRHAWLRASPFDESLHPSGVGDNYGVAMGFPGPLPIIVITGLRAIHHRSQSQRIPTEQAFVLRVLALDLFMQRNSRFSLLNRLFLRWSVGGNVLANVLAGDIRAARTASRALRVLFQRRTGHPLWERFVLPY